MAILLFSSCYTKFVEKQIALARENKIKGNCKKAKRIYSKLIRQQSKNPDFYIERAECRYISSAPTLKNKSKVNSDYNKALNIKPWYINALKSRARFFFFLGDENYKYCIRDINDVISRYGEYAEGYLLKSKIYFNYRDSANAYGNYHKALSLISSIEDKKKLLYEIANEEYYNKYYANSIKTYLSLMKLDSTINLNEALSRSYWKINSKDSSCFYFKNSNSKLPYDNTLKEIFNYCK